MGEFGRFSRTLPVICLPLVLRLNLPAHTQGSSGGFLRTLPWLVQGSYMFAPSLAFASASPNSWEFGRCSRTLPVICLPLVHSGEFGQFSRTLSWLVQGSYMFAPSPAFESASPRSGE